MEERTLAFRIDEEFHRDLKVMLAEKGITLKAYVLGLIKNDLYSQKNVVDVKENVVDVKAIHEKALDIIKQAQEIADNTE